MLITVSGSVSRVDVIHVKEGIAVQFYINTIYGEKEVLRVSDDVFRSKFRGKFNYYESFLFRRIVFKLEYTANKSLKLIDCYLI